MKYTTTYKLEDFILSIRWDALPQEVRERLKGCFTDLCGALIIGSRSRQFEAGIRLAETVFHKGNVPVIGSEKRFDLFGAAAAMGHSSNAYDIDDGHNMTRAHPGTSFIGALLAFAYEMDITRNQLFEAMLAAYETTIRSGAAIMEYYQFAHSSGTFGAVGVAAGAGKILGFTRHELNNALSVAEFNAPLVPGIRSVEYPSMNKDGVPFGIMTGMLAVQASRCGFTGNKNLLESDEHSHFLDDLGTKYQIMDLYFKPYSCCRWAHPAIDACIDLMNQNNITYNDIDHVTIYTFKRATLLSKIVPGSSDEAQYNIAYPVAAAIVYGDFSLAQVREENLGDEKVIRMMSKLSFETDEELDRQFPARRICRAEIMTVDGRVFLSDECEPRGEACENISVAWLCDKFRRITSSVFSKEGQSSVLSMITGEADIPVREIIDEINNQKYWTE